MYQFPDTLDCDKKVDSIYKEHINSTLLYMINRQINLEYDENGKLLDTNELDTYIMNFFPPEFSEMEYYDQNACTFLTLKAYLEDKREYSPTLLMEYVIAKMLENEALYACGDVLDAFLYIVEKDDLKNEIGSLLNQVDTSRPLKKYNINQSIEIANVWNNDRNDKRLREYCFNVRVLIKEALDAVNNKGSNFFTKEEALRLLDLITGEKIDFEVMGVYILETNIPYGSFFIEKYTEMFGHPAIYKIPAADRMYVVKKEIKSIKEINKTKKKDNKEDVSEVLYGIMADLEDIRRLLDSDLIFGDLNYKLIDEIGFDAAYQYVYGIDDYDDRDEYVIMAENDVAYDFYGNYVDISNIEE